MLLSWHTSGNGDCTYPILIFPLLTIKELLQQRAKSPPNTGHKKAF